MKTLSFFVLFGGIAGAVFAQSPRVTWSFEDRVGTTGHTIVADGKSFGPFREGPSWYTSNSETVGFFVVTKRDRLVVIAQQKEFPPLPARFEVGEGYISNDGTTVFLSLENSDTGKSLLWVNGKIYGPYDGVGKVALAEQGGTWAAIVTKDESHVVVLNGAEKGTYSEVEDLWLTPDGKFWGWAAHTGDETTDIVTQEGSWADVADYDVSNLDTDAPHWGFGFTDADGAPHVIVDGAPLPHYGNFKKFRLTYSGTHWGFSAVRYSDAGDTPVVVIDGKEYVGQDLYQNAQGGREWFSWTVRDGATVSQMVLSLN